MKTTLNKIKSHSPCEESWRKLLSSLGKTKANDTEVSIEYILDLLGLDDALWALRAVDGYDREIRLLACDYAEHVLHLYEEKFPDDNRPRQAIEVSRRYANGDATKEELAAAWSAWGAEMSAASVALDAAMSAAWYTVALGAARAARAAAEAAMSSASAVWGEGAAIMAARAAEREDERQWQEQKLRELLKTTQI